MGFNGFFSKPDGGGFLTEHFPEAQKSIWDFNGMFTKSRHIPRVEFAGLIHPGLMGCLPSKEMLAEWNRREKELYDTEPDRVPGLANLPYAETAHMEKRQGKPRRTQQQKAPALFHHGNTVDIATSKTFPKVPKCISRST